MRKLVKLASMIMALTVALTAVSGCGGTTEGTGENGSAATIKLGGIGPITGGQAIYGNAVERGMKIAIDEVNAKGGIQFELRFEDDENDAEKSINAYNKLKDWGMQILVGTVTTTPCIAVSAKSNEDKVFTLTPSASSTDVIGGQPDKDGNVTIPRKENIFQMCFTDPNQGVASAQYISEKQLGSKIGIIYNSSDAYSTGIYQKFETEAKELGLNIVSVKSFTDDSATDFNSQLNDIKAAGADLLFLPIYYTPASLILSQASKMQYEPKVFGVDGMDGILTVENFDTSLAEGVMLLTPFTADAEDEMTKSFVSKYQELYNETPNQFAADGYDCILALYDACTKQNITPDMSAEEVSQKLVEQFTSADFSINGLTGTDMKWSETGEISKAPKGMVIQNGVYVGM